MLECPNCHTQGPSDAPPEVMRLKFYKHKDPNYYTCLECTRRFSVRGNVRVS